MDDHDETCETCEGDGEVLVGFGLRSDMRPGIAVCPDCRGMPPGLQFDTSEAEPER